jgi:hypothetical protein
MLSRPFSPIEIKVQHLRDYVGKWLQFQSLWDLETDYVFNRFGEDLAHWQQESSLHVRYVQDASGMCAIDYEQVQVLANAKYDSWQQDILSRFGVKLGNPMKEMHASILKASNELEHHLY